MKKPRKLTLPMLRRLVLEEKEKYEKDLKAAAKKTREVDADEYADTLEKKVDHLAMLKIKESKLVESLRAIRRQKDQIRQSLVQGDKNRPAKKR